jgi:hypothetical protein
MDTNARDSLVGKIRRTSGPTRTSTTPLRSSSTAHSLTRANRAARSSASTSTNPSTTRSCRSMSSSSRLALTLLRVSEGCCADWMRCAEIQARRPDRPRDEPGPGRERGQRGQDPQAGRGRWCLTPPSNGHRIRADGRVIQSRRARRRIYLRSCSRLRNSEWSTGLPAAIADRRPFAGTRRSSCRRCSRASTTVRAVRCTEVGGRG